jgi:hypothetical protein
MTAILYSPEWRDLALAFCAARDAAMYSPPSGGPSASRSDADGFVAATPGVAGLPDSQPSRGAVGQAPGPSDASPRNSDPGVPISSSQPHGAAGGERSAGTTAFEAAVVPATTSAVTS